MQITTNGLVIWEKALNDDNRIITILTDNHGVITAYAKTVKKLNSRIAASTEIFSYSSFVLFSSKERYTVDKADSLRIFFKVRMDLEKLSLSSYFSELMVNLAPEHENTNEYLRFFLNTLYMIEDDKRPLDFIKPVFELRLLTMAGYMPDLVACSSCGLHTGQHIYFLPQQGCLYCCDCWNEERHTLNMELSPSHLAAMRHIIYSKMELLFQFKLASDALEYIGWVIEEYVKIQLEKTFKSLGFYHSLKDIK